MQVRVTEFVIKSIDQLKRNENPPLDLSRDALEEPPVPQDTPVQELLFEPPLSSGQSSQQVTGIVLGFAMSDPHVALRMQRAVRSIYVLYGNEGLKSLHSAIAGEPKRPWTLKGQPPIGADPTYDPLYYRNSDNVPSFDQMMAAKYRLRLSEQYLLEEKRIQEIVEHTQNSVKSTALTIAVESLGRSEKLVREETERYVGNDSPVSTVLNTNLVFPLKGKEITDLAKALLRIDNAREPIQRVQDLYDKLARPVISKRGSYMQERFQGLSEEEAKNLSSIVEIGEDTKRKYPDTEEMQQAQKIIGEKEAEFAAGKAAEATTFPILYRLWNPSIAQVVRTLLSKSTNYAQVQAALSGSLELRRAVLATLRQTWRASQRIRDRIEKNNFEVWRYPPLISGALLRLVVPAGTIEWQATNERLEQEKASVITTLSMVACGMEFGLAEIAPPLAIAAGLINLGLTIWEWVLDFFQTIEQRDSFNCSLNPALSLAVEPSYVGLLVNLAFIVLLTRDETKSIRKIGKVTPVP